MATIESQIGATTGFKASFIEDRAISPNVSTRPFSDTQKLYAFLKNNGIVESVKSGLPDGLAQARFQDGVDILDTYLSTDLSIRDIANKLFLGPEAARRLRNRAMELLLQNSPKLVRDAYHIDELQMTKPRTPLARLRASEARGTNILALKASVELGTTALGIKEEFDLEDEALARRRSALKKLGVDVPHKLKAWDVKAEIAKRGEKLSDVEAQIILDKVTAGVFRSCSGSDGPFATLKEAVLLAQLRYVSSLSSLYGSALEGHMPTGELHRNVGGKTVHNRFMFRSDLPRAVKILQNDKALSRFVV